jgi:hypothetical protein
MELFKKLLLATLIMTAIGDYALAVYHYGTTETGTRKRHDGAKADCPICHPAAHPAAAPAAPAPAAAAIPRRASILQAGMNSVDGLLEGAGVSGLLEDAGNVSTWSEQKVKELKTLLCLGCIGCGGVICCACCAKEIACSVAWPLVTGIVNTCCCNPPISPLIWFPGLGFVCGGCAYKMRGKAQQLRRCIQQKYGIGSGEHDHAE